MSKLADKNKLNDLDGKEWLKHTKSFYLSTKSKYDKAAMKHPAPFLINDVSWQIEMFTKSGMTVLDPFVGSGTTLIAAGMLGRQSIGFDLQQKFKELYISRVEENNEIKTQGEYLVGDSLELIKNVDDLSLDYIITSPPYHNILSNKRKGLRKESDEFRTGSRIGVETYSEDENDLGNQASFDEFMKLLSQLFKSAFAKLKEEKYVTIIISDFTIEKLEVNIQGKIVEMMEENGYRFVGTQILLQDNKPLYPFGYPFKYIINHHHQNVISFIKPKSTKIKQA